MLKEEKINPWQDIQSLYDLQFFICPSCPYVNNSKQEFVNHAYFDHPESDQYLRNIGKKHALKKYDQFALDTSCFWGKYRIKSYLSCANSRLQKQ